MGSFTVQCAISHLPIEYNERAKVLLMRIRNAAQVQGAYFNPADLLAPMMPPVDAAYNYYGGFQDPVEDEDWGLFHRKTVLETLKGNLVEGTKLFPPVADGDRTTIRTSEWDLPGRDKIYPLATLFVRKDVWDYLLTEHLCTVGWGEEGKTFKVLWERLEAYLRAHIDVTNRGEALEVAGHMYEFHEKHGRYSSFMFDRDYEGYGITGVEEHAYLSGQGADIYLATPPQLAYTGMPPNIQEWMNHLVYNPIHLQRCWDDPAFLDRNIAGMKALAEMVHVHLCLTYMRRAWMPSGGAGVSRANYDQHLQFHRKIVKIAKSRVKK